MKIKCVDKRTFIITEKEAQMITDAKSYYVKINGEKYYLGKMERLFSDVYEATYLSENRIEIELEVMNDAEMETKKQNQIKQSKHSY